MSQDRRIRRTQNLLGQALVTLVLEKGYKNITIQEVTDYADIGYRTYFRHYAGLEELFIDVAQERLDELYAVLIPLQPDEYTSNPVAIFQKSGEAIFGHIQNNQKILRAILLDNELRFILDPVMKMASQKTENLINSLIEPNIATPIAANHIIASVFALMRWWLENDMPYSPERMGEIYTDLIIQPTWLAITSK